MLPGRRCLAFAVLWFLVRSPFGRVIQGISQRAAHARPRLSGARYKFACFVIGGALAGLAGHFYVLLTSLADPSIVDWLAFRAGSNDGDRRRHRHA